MAHKTDLGSAFLIQKPMLRVCAALIPLVLAATFYFGLRALVITAVSLIVALITEAGFTRPQGKPVTSAALVSGLIFALSLPPTLPFGMAAVGIVVGIALGKMAFGGFGRNVFNPAMVGRCFLYITFPIQMTSRWAAPLTGGARGFSSWSADTITQATPLETLLRGSGPPWSDLFLGTTSGSLGETSALLILVSGIFLLLTKTASWRLFLSYLLGGALAASVFHWTGPELVPAPLSALAAGSFLFGAVFVVTEPVSGAKTRPGQWIYGALTGGLIIVLRAFSNFAEGVMFAILIMNGFVPLLDQTVRQFQIKRTSEK